MINDNDDNNKSQKEYIDLKNTVITEIQKKHPDMDPADLITFCSSLLTTTIVAAIESIVDQKISEYKRFGMNENHLRKMLSADKERKSMELASIIHKNIVESIRSIYEFEKLV